MSTPTDDILKQALDELATTTDLTSLDAIRVQYLGKKGIFTAQMKELGTLPPEERREAGQVINQAKDVFQENLDAKKLNSNTLRSLPVWQMNALT